jgi:hypothetical protein
MADNNTSQHRIAFSVVDSEGPSVHLTPPSFVNSNLRCNSYVSNIDFGPGAAGAARMCVGVMVANVLERQFGNAPGLNNVHAGRLGPPWKVHVLVQMNRASAGEIHRFTGNPPWV